jgi:hypothetical protein
MPWSEQLTIWSAIRSGGLTVPGSAVFRLVAAPRRGGEAPGHGGGAFQGQRGEAPRRRELLLRPQVQLDGAAPRGVGMDARLPAGHGGRLLLAGEADVEERGAVHVQELPAADAEGALPRQVPLRLLHVRTGEQFLEQAARRTQLLRIRRAHQSLPPSRSYT